jgi:hypothetical protein
VEQHFALRALPHTRLVVQKSPNIEQHLFNAVTRCFGNSEIELQKPASNVVGQGFSQQTPARQDNILLSEHCRVKATLHMVFSQLHFLLTCIVCSAWESHVLLCHVTKKFKFFSFVANISNYYLQLDLNIVLNKVPPTPVRPVTEPRGSYTGRCFDPVKFHGEYVMSWPSQHIGKQLSIRGKGQEPNEVGIKARPPPSRRDLDSLASWHKMLKCRTWRFFSICDQLFQDFWHETCSIIGTFINPF